MMDRGYDLCIAAREAIGRGAVSNAVELLRESISISPHYRSHELLGERYTTLQQPGLAVRELEKAVQLNPRSEKSQCLLAGSLANSDRVEEAKEVLNAILAGNPTYGPANRLLSSLQSRRQESS